MKKMHWILLPALLTAATACEKARFGNATGKKGGGEVIPRNGMVNPAEEPLDLSELEKNQDKAIDGPQPRVGQVLDKAVELNCDTSTGIIVDVDEGSGTGDGQGDGGSGDGGSGDGKGDGGGKSTEPLKLTATIEEKGGKGVDPVDIDESGNVKGGKGSDDSKGGKPLPEEPPVEVPQEARVHAKVKGAFCPASQNKLTVLFVVDHSGSMGRHVPEKGYAEVPGNDPQINGSCGRLRAAEAIIAKINAKKKPGDQVQVGMVPFAGGIVTSKVQQIIPLEQFEQLVHKDTFCQYVVQGPSSGYDPVNPGGINGGVVDSSTNYKAAFTAAQSLLSQAYGRKVVYFISDGEPTSGGVDPVQAGIEAGNALRANVDNLELNALLLGNMPPAAKTVLDLVAGNASRVRTADNADQLADEILNFPDAAIDENSGNAWLTVLPYKPREQLGLRYLAKDLNQDNVWIYETQPFVLLGKPGEEVINEVEVTAKGLDGTTHSAIVKIRYKQ